MAGADVAPGERDDTQAALRRQQRNEKTKLQCDSVDDDIVAPYTAWKPSHSYGKITVDIVSSTERAVMVRKQAKGKVEMNTTEMKLRAVRLEVPEDVHELLRLEAARQDTSLAALARTAVEEYLSKRKPSAK